MAGVLSALRLICATVFLGAVLPAATQAAEFCVSDAAGLNDALASAVSNSQDDIIRLEAGDYIGTFIYATTTEGEGLEFEGGYDQGCVTRAFDSGATVLDALGSDVVLVLSVDGFTLTPDLKLSGLTIRNGNSASDGGGLYVKTRGSLHIVDSKFKSNHSDANGGGLFVAFGAAGVFIDRTSFIGNTSASIGGGAASLSSVGTFQISNSLFIENGSYTRGGALLIGDSSSASSADAIVNNTFAFNYLTDYCSICGGAGLYLNLSNESAPVEIRNNVFFRNTIPPGDEPRGVELGIVNDPDDDFIVRPTYLSNNVWGNDPLALWLDRPAVEDVSNLASESVRFRDWAAYDYRPAPSSILVDRADTAAGPLGDFAGELRPQGPRSEIGAYETPPVLLVRHLPESSTPLAILRWSDQEEAFSAYAMDPAGGTAPGATVLLNDSVRDLTSIPDISDSGNPEIAALGVTVDGSVRVQIRDSRSGNFVRNQLFFDAGWNPLAVAPVPDLGSDGAQDLAVMAEAVSTGEIAVQFRDSVTGNFVSNVFFLNANWIAQQLLQIGEIDANPGPEIGVLANSQSGQIVVMIKDAKTNSFIKNVFFLNANWEPIQSVVLEDIDNSGAQEIGLLAKNRDSGQLVVMVKDAATNTFLNNIFPFGSGWQPIKILALPDENANGSQELAVLAANETTGKLVVQVRDSLTGQFLRNLEPLGSNWEPQNMIFLPDIGGGIPGLSVLATRKSDDMPVVQTIEAISGDLVGNVFPN